MEERQSFSEVLQLYMTRRFGNDGTAGSVARAVNSKFELDDAEGLKRQSINNWLKSNANPRDWWQVAAMSCVLCETEKEADEFLRAADHMSIAVKRVELEKRALMDELTREKIEKQVILHWNKNSSNHIDIDLENLRYKIESIRKDPSRGHITLSIPGDINAFTQKQLDDLVGAICAVADIDPEEVFLQNIVSGSVRVTLELSQEDARKFVYELEQRHPELEPLSITIEQKFQPKKHQNNSRRKVILCLAAEPSDLVWLQLGREHKEILEAVNRAIHGHYFVPQQIMAATARDVYVRVRNRGSGATTGTEELHLYWAKASTGLSWDTQWVDYLANNCGPTDLYGAEITKARKNAATATAAERAAYVKAILDIDATPAFVFPDNITYWHKQNQLHQSGPLNRHGSPAFLPWHREMMNRYEILLQEADPTVKLLYWDWTTDPENSTGGFNFFTNLFMGNSGRGTGGISIGAPFAMLGPPAVTRNLNTNTTPPTDSDATLLASGPYQNFAPDSENGPNHNFTHGYIGGGGNMSGLSTAAEDPFFFLLHTNLDRLWAQWQRDPAILSRLDPATAYDLDSGNSNITTNMGPWDGSGSAISPWTVADGYIVNKSPQHPSVVSPPIYDTAPLVVPPLQPGEAVIIEISWYPPNPADFSCFGGDQGHFCLLGRIEETPTAPFGMTFPEGISVNTNTRNNNNIAWKNITVVDDFSGALKLSSILIRNVFDVPVQTGLRFENTQEFGASFFDFGSIFVDLKPELYKRWQERQGGGTGIEPIGDGVIQIFSPSAMIVDIPLEPEEAFFIDVRFELNAEYEASRGLLPKWDLIQIGAPDDPDEIVGGQRFEINFQKLVLAKAGGTWRYLDDGSSPDSNWNSTDFDDSEWKQGLAELGFGDSPVTTIDSGLPNNRHITTYFRQTFDIADPGFYQTLLLRLKRDDGAVVYLNEKEIHRVNLPEDAISPDTTALREVVGLEEEMFFPTSVTEHLKLLREGQNVVAVEIHQDSSDSDDLSFDLELSANPVTTQFPPDVEFVSPIRSALFQVDQIIPIEVEALDSDGEVTSVSLFVDGELLNTLDQPPYIFEWDGASIGTHRLRAVATDDEQFQNAVERPISVLRNVPPTVELTAPNDDSTFLHGETIQMTAQASDSGGLVKQVEFRVRDMEQWFTIDEQVLGSAEDSPYKLEISDLPPGHYMLSAVAIDNLGVSSQSIPIHFSVSSSFTENLFLPFVARELDIGSQHYFRENIR